MYEFDDVSSDEDLEDYNVYSDDSFREHLKALAESNHPSDKKNFNLILVNAAKTKDIKFYTGLISLNEKLQVLNDKGQTAMHIAFYHDWDEVLEHALEYHDAPVNYSDCNGLTHLHIACGFWMEESYKLMEIYLKSGAEVNATFEFDPKGLRSGFTALHMCVVGEISGIDRFKMLLKYGANVMARDKMGRTPLHLLCSVYRRHDNLEGMSLLLEKGSEVDAKDKEGNTPLHSVFFISRKNEFPYDFSSGAMYQKYKFLRDHHADVTAINNDGNTVLHCVIMNLKQFRCDPDGPDFDDAIHVKIINEIFSSREGIDVNAKNNAGESFLQIAVSMLSADIVTNLVKRNADVTGVTLSRDGQHCFYNDSIFLPNFETVVKAITIFALLLERGFKFTDDDKLAFIRFLLQDNDDDTWMNALEREKIEAYLDNLLNYGSTLKVHRIYRLMTITLLAQNKFYLQNVMYKYVKKWLQYKVKAGIYYDEALINFLNIEINSKFERSSATYFKARPDIAKEMRDELVLMETTYLNDTTTMLEVLQQHPNDIYQCIADVDPDDITSEYSIYKTIVEGHFTKSLVRNLIKELVGNDFLKKLVYPAFPDICCRIIFFHLDSEDILNVLSVVT